MKKKKDEKNGIFSRLIRFFKSINKILRTNPAIYKTVVWSLSLIILFISIGGGFIHKHNVQTKRALTLSDIDQEISFSQTDTKVQLVKQKRYKDMTVIPIKFDSNDKQSLDAKDYLVGIEPREGNQLSKNISASLVSFSADGNMALVLKGDLPKQPLQILLRNDNNYSDTRDGNGTYMNWGKEQKTKLNVVAFTINPKGDNVEIDKRIESDMQMKDLYAASFGDAQLQELSKEKSKTQDKIKRLSEEKEEVERQIKQLNIALDRKEKDFELSSINHNDENDTGYESKLEDTDYDNLKKSDLSTSDMETVRNSRINRYNSLNDKLEDENRNLKGISNKKKEVENKIENMYELTTISNRYKIMN